MYFEIFYLHSLIFTNTSSAALIMASSYLSVAFNEKFFKKSHNCC
jgi:hypothetical protein